ncbi:MAG: hypothetical protein JWP29_115 [Rhodoferax sp.]|nr:hypothetical protein [Rhodoferax sp.]
MQFHQDIDARSLALHRLIAQRVARDPALLARAQLYLREWAGRLAQGAEACLAVAVKDPQRAAALRQCSTFTNFLSNAARFAFLKSWKSHATQ